MSELCLHQSPSSPRPWALCPLGPLTEQSPPFLGQITLCSLIWGRFPPSVLLLLLPLLFLTHPYSVMQTMWYRLNPLSLCTWHHRFKRLLIIKYCARNVHLAAFRTALTARWVIFKWWSVFEQKGSVISRIDFWIDFYNSCLIIHKGVFYISLI